MRREDLWNKFDEHLQNEQLTVLRRDKLKAMFLLAQRGMQVPLAEAQRPDIEQFIRDLHSDKIRKITKWHDDPNQGRLSSTTKSDVKKFLKQFYKWLRGNNELYPPEVAWIRTRIAKDQQPPEKEVLGLEEAQRLAESLKNEQYHVLTLLLFDSGFRINEMLSVKKRNLVLEEFDENQKCYWVECTESKTVKRKVPVPLFTEDIRHFTNSYYFKQLGENDSLFSVEYAAYLKQLKTVSKKLFKKKITPHALRHSSATYYAKAFGGNMNLIADRFGWTYSSKELATYIRKSGAYQKPQAKQIYTNDVQKIKEENEQLKEHMRTMQEHEREQAKRLEELQEEVKRIALLALNQGWKQ